MIWFEPARKLKARVAPAAPLPAKVAIEELLGTHAASPENFARTVKVGRAFRYRWGGAT